MSVKRYTITIHGKVQGVGFREAASSKANELGIVGFVQNLPDNSVRIEAQAEQAILDKFLAWCQIGPSMAKVSRVEKLELSLKHFIDFEIIMG